MLMMVFSKKKCDMVYIYILTKKMASEFSISYPNLKNMGKYSTITTNIDNLSYFLLIKAT